MAVPGSTAAGEVSERSPLIVDAPTASSRRRSRTTRWVVSSIVACVALCAAALAVHASAASSSSEGSTLEPIWYLHIPKTATPFMLEVVYAMCPEMPRVDITTPQCVYQPEGCVFASPSWRSCQKKFAHMSPGHVSPPDALFRPARANTTSLVGMFRDPKARVASGYAHAFHDCPAMAKRYGCDEHANELCAGAASVTEAKVAEYFECVRGCQGRMLTGGHCHRDVDFVDVDVAEAVRRIDERFAFAGITERFAASVMDFRALVGARGAAPPAAFARSNPQRGGARGERLERTVMRILDRLGLEDEVDEAVYAAALRKNEETRRRPLARPPSGKRLAEPFDAKKT